MRALFIVILVFLLPATGFAAGFSVADNSPLEQGQLRNQKFYGWWAPLSQAVVGSSKFQLAPGHITFADGKVVNFKVLSDQTNKVYVIFKTPHDNANATFADSFGHSDFADKYSFGILTYTPPTDGSEATGELVLSNCFATHPLPTPDVYNLPAGYILNYIVSMDDICHADILEHEAKVYPTYTPTSAPASASTSTPSPTFFPPAEQVNKDGLVHLPITPLAYDHVDADGTPLKAGGLKNKAFYGAWQPVNPWQHPNGVSPIRLTPGRISFASGDEVEYKVLRDTGNLVYVIFKTTPENYDSTFKYVPIPTSSAAPKFKYSYGYLVYTDDAPDGMHLTLVNCYASQPSPISFTPEIPLQDFCADDAYYGHEAKYETTYKLGE